MGLGTLAFSFLVCIFILESTTVVCKCRSFSVTFISLMLGTNVFLSVDVVVVMKDLIYIGEGVCDDLE